MAKLYCYYYVKDDKITFARTRLTPEPTQQYYGVERLFTILEFDTRKQAEHARTPIAIVLRRKFGITRNSDIIPPPRQHKRNKKTNTSRRRFVAVILNPSAHDICWPNRFVDNEYFRCA